MSIRPVSALFIVLVAACSSSGTGTTIGTSTPADGGASSEPDASTDAGKGTDTGTSSGGSGTSFTGTLGALGAAKPTVSSLWISNSGESLVYLSSATITCDMLKTSRWLGSVTAGAQVIELVLKGAPAPGTLAVPPAEVNYAGGGKSSSYEVTAASGSITFTKAAAGGVVEGTASATYDNGDTLEGTFHAEFCAGGQGY